MLRVLIVYYEPQPSGQTAHVLSLVKGLERNRFHLTVALPTGLEPAAAALEQAGARTVPLALRKAPWGLRTIRAFVRLVHQGQFDVVHIHSQEAGMHARVLARLGGARRVLYTPQTIDIRRARWQGVYAQVERALAVTTDTIVSVNEADRARLIGWGIPAHKVVTIPNGIDLALFEASAAASTEELRREMGCNADGPLVLQVGRLTAQKDPLTFVEGAARVVRACAGAQCVLVGGGPLCHAAAERIAELGLAGRVILAGPREQAYRLAPAADVVTLTSRWEGTPYALLEAMAWGRPVVATAVNGCPEIVAEGETGHLAPPGDPEAWAAKVIALLQDPGRAAAMGRQGRRRVEECYALAQMIARLEAVYLSASVAPAA